MQRPNECSFMKKTGGGGVTQESRLTRPETKGSAQEQEPQDSLEEEEMFEVAMECVGLTHESVRKCEGIPLQSACGFRAGTCYGD